MNSKIRTGVMAAAGVASVLVLTACSATGPGSSAEKSPANYKINFIQGIAGDEFYVTMQCGSQAEAQKLGVKVNTQGPANFDPTLQKPILDSVAASHPDAILIAPADNTAMQAPLKAAARNGAKIVLVDTTVDNPSFATSQVTSDNEGGGTAAFQAIKQLAPKGGKILVLSVDPGITTDDARVAGFEKGIKADPSFTELGVQYSHNDPATAARLISAALAKDPDIVGVFATNNSSVAGTRTGVRQAAKQDQVKVVGFDAGPDQVAQLKDGSVQALIAQDPSAIGAQGLDQAVNAIQGKPVTTKIQTGFHVLTAQNITGDGAQYVYKSSCN
jgi:ribose transport system substrate-binding protein